MAQLVYIDETGSVGKGAKRQPFLTLVAAIVDEQQVNPLSAKVTQIAWDHLGWVPADFELHGHELWNGTGIWSGKHPTELLAAFESAIDLIPDCGVSIAHASIDKAKLHARYNGDADGNAYRLALQFLLEKVDSLGSSLKVLVADEAKEQQFPAMKMVHDMKKWSGGGEVPGRQLKTVIDSLHFVSSHANSGVQLADLAAFIIHRDRIGASHPEAAAALQRMRTKISESTPTWRNPWPT